MKMRVLFCLVELMAAGAVPGASAGEKAGQVTPVQDPFQGPLHPLERVEVKHEAVTAENTTEPPPFVLRAIMISRVPLADIDGRILGVGETIGGYKVISIREDGVALKKGGRVMTLELAGGARGEVQ